MSQEGEGEYYAHISEKEYTSIRMGKKRDCRVKYYLLLKKNSYSDKSKSARPKVGPFAKFLNGPTGPIYLPCASPKQKLTVRQRKG